MDIVCAVGCLLSINERTAFGAFRSALPALTKDFEKLEQVAVVGMATATVWDNQPSFLDECAALRVDAMWCKLLESLSVRADFKQLKRGDDAYIKCVRACVRACDCGDVGACVCVRVRSWERPALRLCGRSVVPILLQQSSVNLELAWHFCLTYKLDPQLSVLAYIEYNLLHSADSGYQSKIKNALRVHPCGRDAVVALLSAVLPRVSPIDYDRIQFVYNMMQAHGAADTQGVLERNLLAVEVLRHFSPVVASTVTGRGTIVLPPPQLRLSVHVFHACPSAV